LLDATLDALAAVVEASYARRGEGRRTTLAVAARRLTLMRILLRGARDRRHLIAHSYACRTGLGTHAALAKAKTWARGYRHFAHLDVAKFFPTVDHGILLAQLARHIPCTRTLDLCARIVAAGGTVSAGPRWHFPGDDLFTPQARSIGLPIGNLTSQHFANRYLSPVDHRAKDRLRVRAYLRYMDDVPLFGDDRSAVEEQVHALEEAF